MTSSAAGQPDPYRWGGRRRWTWALTPQQWRGLVSTVSHVGQLPAEEGEAALDETERLVTQACAASNAATVLLVHDAVCVRWHPGT